MTIVELVDAHRVVDVITNWIKTNHLQTLMGMVRVVTFFLSAIAQWLDQTVGHQANIVILIGLISAVVDNMPLVAASMGMYRHE